MTQHALGVATVRTQRHYSAEFTASTTDGALAELVRLLDNAFVEGFFGPWSAEVKQLHAHDPNIYLRFTAWGDDTRD
jgi:hypothetical protein